jgi:DNA-binding IclR family transcriptional regulator
MQDVEHVAGEALSVGRPYFANLWSDAGERGRQVLRVAARQAEGCAREILQAQSGLRQDELRQTVRRLAQYQLIEQMDGRWRVQVELTRRAFVGLAGDR